MQNFAKPVAWLTVIIAGALFITPFIIAAAFIAGTISALVKYDKRNR